MIVLVAQKHQIDQPSGCPRRGYVYRRDQRARSVPERTLGNDGIFAENSKWQVPTEAAGQNMPFTDSSLGELFPAIFEPVMSEYFRSWATDD